MARGGPGRSRPGPYPQAQPWQFRPAQPDQCQGCAAGLPGAALGQGAGPVALWGAGPVPRSGARPDPGPAGPAGRLPARPGPAASPRHGPNAAQPPRLEWSIDETQPYVQQNLLLRLQLISGDDLTTADPDLAGGDDFLVQAIAAPTTSTRNLGDGRRELVTQFSVDPHPPAPRQPGTAGAQGHRDPPRPLRGERALPGRRRPPAAPPGPSGHGRGPPLAAAALAEPQGHRSTTRSGSPPVSRSPWPWRSPRRARSPPSFPTWRSNWSARTFASIASRPPPTAACPRTVGN